MVIALIVRVIAMAIVLQQFIHVLVIHSVHVIVMVTVLIVHVIHNVLVIVMEIALIVVVIVMVTH